jgi:hypothetical protein
LSSSSEARGAPRLSQSPILTPAASSCHDHYSISDCAPLGARMLNPQAHRRPHRDRAMAIGGGRSQRVER